MRNTNDRARARPSTRNLIQISPEQTIHALHDTLRLARKAIIRSDNVALSREAVAAINAALGEPA